MLSESEKLLIEKAGLDEADFKPPEMTADELAEEAYLTAEYNKILIEMMMED